ncbi:hypothetical protein B0H19DRAFT_1247642 [Mycena capillaripes]|nr:hypothetical protein B0H19DRAFT_1247642 [Mycena capillaripes]
MADASRPQTDHPRENDLSSRDANQEDSGDDMRGDDGEDENAIRDFSDAESFYDVLRAEFKARKPIDFMGIYPVPADALVSPRQRVEMAAAEL